MIQFEDYDPLLFRTKMHILGVTEREVAEVCRLTRCTINNVVQGRNCKPSTVLFIGLVLDMMATEEQLMMFQLLEKQNTGD